MNRNKIFRIFALTLILTMLFCCSAAYADTGSSAVLSEAKSAVVRVYAEYDYGYALYTESGTAFGVGKSGTEPQYFVTNAHVCLDDYGNTPDAVYILLDNDAVHIEYDNEGSIVDIDLNASKAIECSIVNTDLELYPDVAVIRAKKPVPGRTCLPLAKSSADVEDGSNVYALGFPADADLLTLSDNEISYVAAISEVNLTNGVVSKKTNSELFGNTDVLLHSATISSGNSGGPLIDENGAVVGINTYGLNTAEANYNLSIYIDYAIDILDEANVEYETYGNAKLVRTIILIAIMVLVAVAAVIIIIRINKSVKLPPPPPDPNALRVQGVSGYFVNRRFPLEGQVSFGRDPGNNIVFPTSTGGVSAHHCVIINTCGQLYIKDLGSSYGTVINGSTRIPPQQMVSIKVGDRFSLGSEKESFIITRQGGKI